MTGWGTIHALTRALQIELGITNTSDSFGPTTTAQFNLQYPNGVVQQAQGDPQTNRVYAIIQGALWCKGYSTGATGITEHFYGGTGSAVISLKTDAGFNSPNSTVSLNIMKGLLSMDQYVLVSGGEITIRTIQQELNRNYELYIGIIPCDGLYGREMNKALIKVLQANLGLTADGIFGAGTKSACPTLPDDLQSFSQSVQEKLIKLVRYSIRCNGLSSNINVNTWNSGLEDDLEDFQSLMALTITRKADIDTWMSLLLSKGNPDRSCVACDTRFEITTSRALQLINNGYEIVGRYLTGTTFKVLRDDEPQRILDNGLYFFPIFQESSDSISYFTSNRGKQDSRSAVKAARKFGIPEGNIIYFAVDLDATSDQITDYIMPYFQSVYNNIDNHFSIGIYGTRNVCSRVCNAGFAITCFVSDMSTGYSGNMGFVMPSVWNFDQFAEVDMSTWAIDKDAYSGRYDPVTELDSYIYSQPPKTPSTNLPIMSSTIIPLIEKLEDLYCEWYTINCLNPNDPSTFLTPKKLSKGITNYLRRYKYGDAIWSIVLIDQINTDFVNYVAIRSLQTGDFLGLDAELDQYIREQNQVLVSDGMEGVIDLKHLAATTEAYSSITTAPKPYTGWAGDLATAMADTTDYINTYQVDCQVAADLIVGGIGTRFSYEDFCSDADAIKIAELINESVSATHSFSESLETYYSQYYQDRGRYIIDDLGCADYLGTLKTTLNGWMTTFGSPLFVALAGVPSSDVIAACINSFANYVYFEA